MIRPLGNFPSGQKQMKCELVSGFAERCEIGFLTAFDYIEDYCKNPIAPFWVVHHGLHYFVLHETRADYQRPDDDTITCFLFLEDIAERSYKSFQVIQLYI